MTCHQIASIILAAGESKRMGFPKPLLEYQGRSFLQCIIEAHRAARLPLYVVLGEYREEIENQTDLSEATVVVNPDPSRGPLSSLQAVLDQVVHSSALILHPVDHPLVSAHTLALLVEYHRRISHCILIPQFHGQKGHPVLFPSRFYADLRSAPLAEGARWVVHQNLPSTFHVPVEDPAILDNINTLDQFQNLQLKLNSNFK